MENNMKFLCFSFLYLLNINVAYGLSVVPEEYVLNENDAQKYGVSIDVLNVEGLCEGASNFTVSFPNKYQSNFLNDIGLILTDNDGVALSLPLRFISGFVDEKSSVSLCVRRGYAATTVLSAFYGKKDVNTHILSIQMN